MATEEFAFRFDPVALPLRFAGITPSTCMVSVLDDRLEVRFGPLRMQTTFNNICDVQTTYGYKAIYAIGARYSFSDGGATYGTSLVGGVCVCFKKPVRALAIPPRPNPGLTMTVEDIDGLAALLRERCGIAPPA